MNAISHQDHVEILAACPRDRYRDLAGPCHPGPAWEAELARIDPRLVLRYQPVWGKYAVFCRMERSNRLWHQPVHIIETAERRLRKPDGRDLAAIRKARYLAERSGARASIDAMDRRLAAQECSDREDRYRLIHAHVSEAARRHDLTYADFGKTIKPFTTRRSRG